MVSKTNNFTFNTPFTIDDPNTKKYIKKGLIILMKMEGSL